MKKAYGPFQCLSTLTWPSPRFASLLVLVLVSIFASLDGYGANRCQFDFQCPVGSLCVDSECRPTQIQSSALCQQQGSCSTDGRCKLQGNRCIAASDEACRVSEVCKLDGRCSLLDGLCQASDQAACRKLRPGKRPRLVRWPIGPDGRLLRTCSYYTNRDCRRTEQCKQYGRCTSFEGACIVTRKHCRRSRGCEVDGACGIRKLPKRFRARDKIARRCELLKASHCRLTRACSESGLCSLYKQPKKAACIAVTASDCRASSACRTQRRCDVKGGRCVENTKVDTP